MNNLVAKYSREFNHSRIHRDRTKFHRSNKHTNDYDECWEEYLELKTSPDSEDKPSQDLSRIGTYYLGKRLIGIA